MQMVEMYNKQKVIYGDGWYEGEWKNGEFHGQGTRTWSSGKSILGNGRMDSQMVKEQILSLMEENMLGNSKMGNMMVKELKLILME